MRPRVLQFAIETCRAAGRIPWLERLYLRFTRNRLHGGLISKLLPNAHQYPPGSIRQVVRNGLEYELDLSDLQAWYLYWGFTDPSLERLKALLAPGMTYVDVGANIGTTTLEAARIAGPQGRVIAYEPDPVNFARLRRNISLNNLAVDARNLGLSDRTGSAFLETPNPSNRASNRVADTGTAILVSTLDVAFASIGGRLDVLKIDVEGHEISVLRGAVQTIARFKPLLFIECIDEQLRLAGGSARELIALLGAQEYLVCSPDGTVLTPRDGDGCYYLDITCRHR